MKYESPQDAPLRQQPMNQDFQTVELRRKEFTARTEINEKEIEICRRRGQIDMRYDHARRKLVMTIHAAIYGKKHPERHIIRYPETWWEAVKERFAPAWFRDRYPVRFVEISASLEELYPEVEPAMPGKTPAMIFLVAKRADRPAW